MDLSILPHLEMDNIIFFLWVVDSDFKRRALIFDRLECNFRLRLALFSCLLEDGLEAQLVLASDRCNTTCFILHGADVGLV